MDTELMAVGVGGAKCFAKSDFASPVCVDRVAQKSLIKIRYLYWDVNECINLKQNRFFFNFICIQTNYL